MSDPAPSILSRLYEVRQAAMRVSATPPAGVPKIITICNQKGGCAKTTTALNVAACLGLKGYSTLLIDLDPQANATLGLGVDVENLTATVYDVFQDIRRRFEEIFFPTAVSNLYLAPASPLLAGAQLELATLLNREQVLRQALQRMTPRFHYVIIDCSPSLNLLTINALTAATFCLVPLQPHYYALEGMKELFNTIELTQARFNPALRLLGIVPVLVDGHIPVTQEILGQIREYFQGQVTQVDIRVCEKFIEASIVGQPMVLYAPESGGADDYHRLTQELMARMQGAASSPHAVHGTTPANTLS